MALRRCWINQPSKLQPCSGMHGLNVIADLDDPDEYTQVYFVTELTTSAIIPKNVLTKGWNPKDYPNQIGELP